MTNPLLKQDEASTPLTPDERADLILSYIAQRRELNEAEQDNILEAEQWALSRKRDVLRESFLRQLHKRMFGNVWKWAGEIRQSKKNIGVEVWKINTELAQLLRDASYWLENSTYALDEIAARFHHRLVWIHPFANGNGRHSRLASDLLLVANGGERFTWGSVNLVDATATRRTYVDALRAADHHGFDLLLAFVRS